jgi:hypothetical protein
VRGRGIEPLNPHETELIHKYLGTRLGFVSNVLVAIEGAAIMLSAIVRREEARERVRWRVSLVCGGHALLYVAESVPYRMLRTP